MTIIFGENDVTAMKKPVMNMNEFSTVTTTFYFCGSFRGLCNYGIIYEHLKLQFNLYYNSMRVVMLLYLMQMMVVHNTYKVYYCLLGARIKFGRTTLTQHVQKLLEIDAYTSAGSEIVRDMTDKLPCVSLNYENELTKAQTSSESKEHYELSDGEAITIGIVIYYSRSQKFESQKDEYHEAISSVVYTQMACYFQCILCCYVCLMNAQITILCITLGQNTSITTEVMIQIQNYLQ